MASFWSTYLKDKVLNHLKGIASYTTPGTSYFAMMTVAPTPAGGGSEVPLPRLAVPNTSASWNAAASGSSTNKIELVLTASSPSDLGTIVGIAEFDDPGFGNMLTYGDLTVPKTVNVGMKFSVLAGNGEFTYIDDLLEE